MKKLLILLLPIILFFACNKKENNNEPSCILEKKSLVGNKYKIISSTSVLNGGTPVDELLLLAACERDDILEFVANNVLNQIDEGLICNPNTSYIGNWDLIGDVLILDGTVNLKVIDFKCSEFTVTYTANFSGNTKVQTVKYSKL